MHFIHTIVLMVYVIIASQFFIAFLYRRDRKAKRPLFFLSAIFVLCAATRFFLEYQIGNFFTDSLSLLLLAVSIGFVLTNQATEIVESLQSEDD